MPYALRPLLFALILILYANQAVSQQIAVFPPQIHQQITPESTISRDLQVFNTGEAALDFQCRFEPWGGWRDTTVSWVTAFPMEGQIGPGDTAIITFDFNSFGLSIENYLVNFMIASNDPKNPDLEVLAMLHVMDLNIYIFPDKDSIDPGDSVRMQVFVLGGTENYIYEWSSNPPGFSSSQKEPIVMPTVSSWFILQVTDGGYTNKDSVFIKVTPSSGIHGPGNVISSITIGPNPCRDHLQVFLQSSLNTSGQIIVTDLTGANVYTREVSIEKGSGNFILDTHILTPGMYLMYIRIRNHDGFEVKPIKFLKY